MPQVSIRKRERLRGTVSDLNGNVGVLLSISVHVVSVDVVAADDAVERLEHDSRVVVGDHVGVAVLGLVDVEVGRVPRELLARLDRLVLVREAHSIVRLQLVDVLREVSSCDRRMTDHCCVAEQEHRSYRWLGRYVPALMQ